MKSEGLIYIAQNKDNDKVYVGQTVDFRVRFNHHRGDYSPSYFDRALKKHGPDKFRFIKIICPTNCLNYWERFFIEKLRSKYPNGYNLTEGGEGMRGYHISEETRKKLKTRKCWNKGKHLSEEMREKLSLAAKRRKRVPLSEMTKIKIGNANRGKISPFRGIPLSDEHKRKIRESKVGSKNPMYGNHKSAETRAKLSAALKGKKSPMLGKKHSEKTRLKMSLAQKARFVPKMIGTIIT